MSGRKTIRDFFSPSQHIREPAGLATTPTEQKTPSRFNLSNPLLSSSISHITVTRSEMGQSASNTAEPVTSSKYTSSLSPPPSSTPEEEAPEKEISPVQQEPFYAPHGRVVKNSDDEDEDSDSELEDLTTIFASKNLEKKPTSTRANGTTPQTPNASRHIQMDTNSHTSPLAVLPKYRFDMNALLSHARDNEAAEASSKRVKAMMASKDETEHTYHVADNHAKLVTFNHGALLESVVADKEEGGLNKVTRALQRTEATITEKRCYFFGSHADPPQAVGTPFPSSGAAKDWENELKDPQIRCQSFLSGFVEDLVGFGKQLPDELFLWILDEACLEMSEPLRTSYFNTLQVASDQLQRLLLPAKLGSLFFKIGATSSAISINQKTEPVTLLADRYLNREWGKLRSLVRFLGLAGESLQNPSRIYVICLLLRMAADRIVLDNVDILVVVQRAINRLCRFTTEDHWESCCIEVCKTLFETIELPTFRLQVVDTIPSSDLRTHELRRRLALCFYFNDVSYSMRHPYGVIDINHFTSRLDDKAFNTGPKTDYGELTALILLLNVAIDDGRSNKPDLSYEDSERAFNEAVDELVATIKDIMTSIGNPGAAFISRIEAKEALELVSQRITDTIRTKMKPKESWFDRNRGRDEEDLEAEKQGMSRFLSKMTGKNGSQAVV